MIRKEKLFLQNLQRICPQNFHLSYKNQSIDLQGHSLPMGLESDELEIIFMAGNHWKEKGSDVAVTGR